MSRACLSFFAALLIALMLVAGCRRDEIVLRGFAMGTNYQIRLRDVPAGASEPELQAAVDALLADINARMSTYESESELARFGRAPAGVAQKLSPATAEVLRAALRVAADTRGAFDPTVPPLLRLWGFGAGARERRTRPAATEIAAAKARVDYRALELKGERLIKTRPGVELDLSAIAKGDAVDRVFELLQARGIRSMMVEIGGEMRVGTGPDGRPWRIGLERPIYDGGREVLRVAELEQRAVASSGDYRNFFEVAGVRYAHIIDPRTGEPARSRVRAATVIGPDCRTADALATALLVLGREAGLRLCESEPYKEFECMLIIDAASEGPTGSRQQGDDAFEIVLSGGMARYLKN